VKEVDGVGPNRTWVAPVRPLPDTVTWVPPDVEPDAGSTELTTGVVVMSALQR